MSQLQVTGEAKIRDIQGPVVANDGVITALDGAASQYVRGDGTLADFPTSSGGGSSVSYYLNSSVSQGTIGGVAYRELSKDPIIGTGTDIAISSNGYVANYITDVNDPDVTIVPGGNFNCEFYFSVNNNTGNPTTYAELYKYDGTTFTLLGTSAGVPESINQGTTIAPYYFAIPVATAALALTDRLAIRIYVNVDGRTVTLHTENGHLCQVVTTFSKGMVSLNNLTDQSQFLTTGTAGTNFTIASSGDTHTFNLPVASATNTGKLSSTDWSTFNNKVPYTGATSNVDLGAFSLTASTVGAAGFFGLGSGTVSGYIALKQGTTFLGNVTGYNSINAISTKYLLISDIGSTNYKSASFELGSLTNNTERTFTLPDLSGTLALLEGSQTFSGNKAFSALTSFTFANGTRMDYGLYLSKGAVPSAFTSLTTNIYSDATTNNIVIRDNSSIAKLEFNNSTQTYTFPNATGTIALTSNLSSYVPYTGATTNLDLGNNHYFGGSILLKQSVGSVSASGYFSLSGSTGSGLGSLILGLGSGTTSSMNFPTSSNYTYTFPAATGTIALTSNLSAYLPLAGGTLTGALSGTSAGFSSTVTSGGELSTTSGLISISGAGAAPPTGGVGFRFVSNRLIVYGGSSDITFQKNSNAGANMTILENGNVGMGTATSPSALLHLGVANAAVDGTKGVKITNPAGTTVMLECGVSSDSFVGTTSASDFSIRTGNSPRMTINSAGVVTITGLGTGTVTATSGVLSAVSDMNLKNEDGYIDNALEKVMNLKPRYYYWKEESGLPTDLRQLGFYAQEVNEALGEEAANTPKTEKDKWGIYDRGMIAFLTKAIQELKAEIDELKNK